MDSSQHIQEALPFCYIFDSSFDGLLSCIAQIHLDKRLGSISRICAQDDYQPSLFEPAIKHETNQELVTRITEALKRKAGHKALQSCYKVFLSDEPRRFLLIFYFVSVALRVGKQVHSMLADKRIGEFLDLEKSVEAARHKAIEFLRFHKTSEGVYFAQFETSISFVPLVMNHFVGRLNVQAFVIYDSKHKVAGVYDGKDAIIQRVENFNPPRFSSDDTDYTHMWQEFYRQITIKERYKPKLRQQQMPKKYWQFLDEMQNGTAGSSIDR